MSSPETSSPASTMSSAEMPCAPRCSFRAKRSRRRIADTELELRLRLDAAVGEIAARLGARRAASVASKNFAASSMTSCSVLRRFSRASASRRRLSAAARPPSRRGARPLRGTSRPSVCITKSKMLPFLPEEKSNHAAFWSFTKNEAVFSLLNGDKPLPLAPGLLELHARPTTSETGSRAFRSSRKLCG